MILETQRLYLHCTKGNICISKGNFDNAVEILKPIRYKIVKIGGSNAQVR